MTQEEKQILLKDLCARLPYGVKGLHSEEFPEWFSKIYEKGTSIFIFTLSPDILVYIITELDRVKPYLRPMSSMTEEELKELNDKYGNIAYFFIQKPPYYHGLQAQHEDIGSIEISEFSEIYDWLDAHYFDYRIVPSTGKTLIESNLAIAAPEEMYGNV